MENWKDTFVDGASGALAGFISSLLLHPLENIRARLQDVQLSDQQKDKLNELENSQSIKFRDKFSSVDFLLNVMKNEGALAFYKGLSITLVGSIITFGIYFFWYKVCKVLAQMNKPSLDSKDMIIITTIAGCICNILTTPVWIIQTRMCVSRVKKSIIDHCKDIWGEGKLLAFWKGFLPGLILVSNPVINFVIYEKLRMTLNLKIWIELIKRDIGKLSFI